MNRKFLVGVLIVVIGVGLIIVGTLVFGRFVRQMLAPLPLPTQAPPITQQIVVTTHDLALGAILKADDITYANIPVEFLPRGTLSDVNAAIGRFVKVPLVAGEMLLETHLADPTNISHDVALVIGDDMVLMAFPATDLMSTLAIPQRGDVVDIFVSIMVPVAPQPTRPGEALPPEEEEQVQNRFFTFDALQRIQISAIVADIITQQQSGQSSTVTQAGGAAGVPTPTPVPPKVVIKAYLLALLPKDALVLKHLRDSGAIFDIVLRSPTSTELFEVVPVMPEYLIDKYQLLVPR